MSREIDALVAEHVMGMENNTKPENSVAQNKMYHYLSLFWNKDTGEYEATKPPRNNFPNYSTDIAAAWSVIDAMLNDKACYFQGHRICVYSNEVFIMNDFEELQAKAESTPMAICLAALKAKGIKIDDGPIQN